jgi:hypothetical protein
LAALRPAVPKPVIQVERGGRQERADFVEKVVLFDALALAFGLI